MLWRNHSRLKDAHAFLGASKWHWINYDEEKLVSHYISSMAAVRGTELHDYARKAILLKIKQANDGTALSKYINDAIDLHMRPEQVLYFSDVAFGTADAISFRDNFLRIHDLKTGVGKVHMEQLYIYAALFCLEYDADPHDIKIELRIYQGSKPQKERPKPDDICHIMSLIVRNSEIIEKLQMEENRDV